MGGQFGANTLRVLVVEPKAGRYARVQRRFTIAPYTSGMPTVTVDRPQVARDEVMEALRQELGADYKVKPGGHEDVFSVDKGTFTGAKVRMKPEGASTGFHVHGTGIIIGRIINELTIARQVASAIAKAPLAQ